MYGFVGLQGKLPTGENGIVCVYCDEGDTSEQALVQARQMAQELQLDSMKAVDYSNSNSGSNQNSNSEFRPVKVEAMVRRIQKNRQPDGTVTQTAAVDLYPPLKQSERTKNWYGMWRSVTVYFNRPEQQEEFEQATGVRLEDMPIYNSQASLQRTPGFPEEFEVKPLKSVTAVCKVRVRADRPKKDGTPGEQLSLDHWENN